MKWNNKDHSENQRVENRKKVKINKPKMYMFEEVDKIVNIYPDWLGEKIKKQTAKETRERLSW